MVINFCYDDLGQYGIGYPNLARTGLDPERFDSEWPRVVPLRLLMHMKSMGINNRAFLIAQAPVGSWYPVAFAWHDFSCDYIGLMAPQTLDRLRQREIMVLFYYHEGDNPLLIRDHLRHRCVQNNVPPDCFLLVSANSAADTLDQCTYFPDHEYFFRWINRHQHPDVPSIKTRPYVFTALNRLHKSWRAHVMADLYDQGLLADSLWSYNHDVTMHDANEEHPLDLGAIDDWQAITKKFLDNGPYYCDNNDSDLQNDHRQVNTMLYSDSYCHIVLETLMDADGSSGAFLTEKTYKCIKFGQPFVIVGTPGSLGQLRQAGYRTFDSVIDPTYDEISDASTRYLEIRRVLSDIRQQDPLDFFQKCLPDILHNQDVFLNHKSSGLDRLLDRMRCAQEHTVTP